MSPGVLIKLARMAALTLLRDLFSLASAFTLHRKGDRVLFLHQMIDRFLECSFHIP